MDLKPFVPAFQLVGLVGVSVMLVALVDLVRRVIRSGTRIGDDSTIEQRQIGSRHRAHRHPHDLDRDYLLPLRRATKKGDKNEALRAVGVVLRSRPPLDGRKAH